MLLLGIAQVNATELEIVPLPEEDLSGMSQAPWVIDGDRSWIESKPLFSLDDPKADTEAKGWLAVSGQNILLRVIVQDDTHVNDKSEGAIWEGDCIQVGLDAMGNGQPDQPMDGNDAAMAFALTNKGALAWAYHHGRPGGAGAMPQIQSTIVRDEQARTTTYDITLPWEEFQSQPGLSPVLGIAVQVNDSDEGTEQRRLYFGQGAGGRPQPGSFSKLRVGAPRVPILAAQFEQEYLWRVGDSGEIRLAIAGQADVKLRVKLGETQEELALPAGAADAGVKRFKIRGTPLTLPAVPLPMEVSVTGIEGDELLNCTTFMRTGDQVFASLNKRIDELATKSKHELMTRHLRTAQAVVNMEWELAQWKLDDSTQLAKNVVGSAQQIQEGLEGDAANWNTYLQRRRKLVLGFMAPSDRTLQYYMVTLPKAWDPGRTYPMIVFLHGAGTSPVASEVVGALLGGRERQEAEARFDGDFDTLYIEPYGRGRHGYHGIAERDVLLAVDDAVRTFMVDPDRTYLTGFSMGGAGAWAVAAHTPDRWAAVCINAGSPRSVPTGIGIGRNFIGLPVRIWHGEADPSVRAHHATSMAEELRSFGITPELIIQPGVSHVYYGEPQESGNLAWLMTHTRKRPKNFGFTAETGDYLTRNGVTLARDPATDFNPWFECRIENHTVRLTSQGAPAMTVQLGEDGLGLDNAVTVFHNDRKVYQGPAATIQINTADGTITKPAERRSRRG